MKTKHLFPLLLALALVACNQKQETVTITILHTNDTHSQVEPINDGGQEDNMGGYARRMGYIQQMRDSIPDLILLDAGDAVQGTPYFNFFDGEVEITALNRMGYDAGTLGNHEFDNGLEFLANMIKMRNHPVVCCNYDATGTILEGLIQPYIILERKGVKVGVIGVGHDPKGIITSTNFEPLVYHEPYEIVDSLATALKEQENCDIVVCLSHLGTRSEKEGEPCDSTLIACTHNVDLVIGGHTHKLVQGHFTNKDGKEVVAVQARKAGIYVGQIDITLTRPKQKEK